MKVTLQLPDDLYDAYCELATQLLPRSASPEDVMISHLDKFKWMQPMTRAVIITGRERERVEELLGGGMVKDPADLVQKLEGLVSIKIEGVEVNFSAGEKQELSIYAAKNGITVQEAVERTVHGMRGQFFNYVTR